jgi:hypothetical protein
MAKDDNDPKGLIREAYRIEGITPAECRSIFLDWALSLPEGVEDQRALQALEAQYGPEWPDHPMTAVLKEGLTVMIRPRMRRGRRARVPD